MIKNNMASYGDLAKICFFSFLGIFTQYSSIIFSFILAACSCSILLWRRNYALLWRYALMMLCSVGLLFLLFPDAWYALLFSQRGTQVQNTVETFFSYDTLFRFDLFIFRFVGVWGTKLLSFSDVNMKVIFIMLCLLITCFWWAKEKFQTIFYVLLFAVLTFGLYVTLLMPFMGSFDMRYFFLITPFMAIISVCVLYKLGAVFLLPKKVFYALLVVLLILNSFYAKPFQKGVFNAAYTHHEDQYLNRLTGKKVVVIGADETILLFRILLFIQSVEQVYFTQNDCNENLVKNADYVLRFSYLVRHSYRYHKDERSPLCEKITPLLRFISKVNMGWRYLDLYEVIKN